MVSEGRSGHNSDIEQALAGGSAQRVGWFRFFFADERWEWSAQVQRMHGYEPGTVTPTTELVLSHKHPDDRHHVAATIGEILHSRNAFCTRHRIVDTKGKLRCVVVVADQLYDDSGVAVIGTYGFYIDVTPSEGASEELITAKVAEIAEHRAVIDEAKGMLMLIYGIDAESAFELLKWRSQETNVKLRLLAEQVLADFCDASDLDPPWRSMYDRLLLTAHLRVADCV